MIDPSNITKFDRTQEELQEFLLFGMFVAGKKATTQAAALHRFLGEYAAYPFERIRYLYAMGTLEPALQFCRVGQYQRLVKALSWIAHESLATSVTHPWLRSLHTVQPSQLEQIPGVGPKTARFFVLHSQRKAQVACLDTHILKFLAAQGVQRVPKSTPSGQEYARLEHAYLELCRKLHVDPAQFDLAIWRHYSEGYGVKAA